MISIHLLGNSEISQLFKLPNLLDHYFEHHLINSDLNFFEFLAMHYAGNNSNDGTDADNEKDQQLPCHNLQHNTLSVVCIQFTQETPVVILVTTFNSKKYVSLGSDNLPPRHAHALIQPPQAA